jgi:hypothetical protein
VPVAPAANALKGARLPSPLHLDKLAEMHCDAIACVSAERPRLWESFRAEYETDLRLQPGAHGRVVLLDAYRGTVLPLLELARRMGFRDG